MSSPRLIIGIVTSPRPGAEYLNATIEGMLRTTKTIPLDIVVAPSFNDCEGVRIPLPEGEAIRKEIGQNTLTILPPLWEETLEAVSAKTPDHRGLERNSHRVLAHLLAQAHAYDGWVVTAQDDLIFSQRAMDRVYQTALWASKKAPNVGCVSFYSPYHSVGIIKRAIWPYPPGKFYGDLLLLWRAECARAYNAHANMFEGRDIDICKWFDQQRAWRLVAHSPCLVQHAGVVSATGKAWAGQRTTMNFLGEDYDAIGRAKPW